MKMNRGRILKKRKSKQRSSAKKIDVKVQYYELEKGGRRGREEEVARFINRVLDKKPRSRVEPDPGITKSLEEVLGI